MDILRPLRRLARDDRGAGLLEYLFLVSLIALVCIAAVTFFGRQGASSTKKSCEHITVAQGEAAGSCG